MITVYIWHPQTRSLSDVGHASMSIGHDYFSMYPAREATKPGKVKSVTGLGNLRWRDAVVIESYEGDCEYSGRPADDKIELFNLNEDKARRSWRGTNEYHTTSINCCTSVADSLLDGVPVMSLGFITSVLKTIELEVISIPRDFIGSIVSGNFSSAAHELSVMNPRKLSELAHNIKEYVG